MNNAVFSRADKLVSAVNLVGIPLFFLYVVCMVFFPWAKGDWDWDNLQEVWDRWQTLNAAILAFIASVIALNIAKYHESKQRERKFIAARAFLPHALSELIDYYYRSAKLILEVWTRLESPPLSPLGLVAALPQLPESYKETFSSCIEQAEPDVGDYLAEILVRLQVHHSRMVEMYESLTTENQTVVARENLKFYIYRLAQLYVLVGKLFPFARGDEKFDNSAPLWEDFRNAYGILKVDFEEIDDLEDFTKRAILRAASTG